MSENNKNIDYMQVVKMTDKEKIKMYMKLRKRKLAEMLLAANKALDALSGQVISIKQDKVNNNV